MFKMSKDSKLYRDPELNRGEPQHFDKVSQLSLSNMKKKTSYEIVRFFLLNYIDVHGYF